MTDRADRLADLLSIANRVVTREVADALEAAGGPTVEKWRALRLLDRNEGRTMGELADRLALPPASATRAVDGLVDKGLAFRSVSDRDRRQVVVLLSAVGAEVADHLESVVAAAERRALVAAGVTDPDGFVATLADLSLATVAQN